MMGGNIKDMNSYERFLYVIDGFKDNCTKEIIKKYANDILVDSCINLNIYDFYTILFLLRNKVLDTECKKIINSSIMVAFDKKSIGYLNMKYKNVINNKYNIEELINDFLLDLSNKKSDDSSVILFNLCVFEDFRIELAKVHPTIATLITAYQIYDAIAFGCKLFAGSTVIGKLLKDDNEKIVEEYLKGLLHCKDISPENIVMIGGGGTNLVYKIDDVVFKIGETRHDRKIYINHRILASLIRKLETNEIGEPLFYVEVMKYIETGNVTKEELQELKSDLYRQGLKWEDAKVENCGVLPDDYDNAPPEEIDYTEYYGHIDNPVSKEEFCKRKRRVVVLDNDCIKFDSRKSSG